MRENILHSDEIHEKKITNFSYLIFNLFSTCIKRIVQCDCSLWCILERTNTPGCSLGSERSSIPEFSSAYNYSWIFMCVQLIMDQNRKEASLKNLIT